jgi:hypothetical protein
VAFAVGDTSQWWEDTTPLRVNGYYWPPGVQDATINDWVQVFRIHNYVETEDSSLEPDYEKVAIYAKDGVPSHVARQKASGMWASKMGKGFDIHHSTLESLSDFYGDIVKVMKRKCQGGKRVLE